MGKINKQQSYRREKPSWRLLRVPWLQENPVSPSYRKSVLNIQWKGWCWSWHSNTLATWCEELTHYKRSRSLKRLKAGEGTTEAKMVEWHHRLDGHEFERALGVGDGQGSLACWSPWGHRVRYGLATEQQQLVKKKN